MAGAMVLTLACRGPSCPSGSTTSASESVAPVIAYQSGATMTLADGSGRTAATFDLPDDQRVSHLSWSGDAQAVTWTAGCQVTLAATLSQRWYRTRSWPELCQGASFLGDELWSVSSDGDALVRLGVSASEDQRIPLHGTALAGQRTTVLAGTASGLLVGAVDPDLMSAHGGPTRLHLLTRDGTVTVLGRAPSNVALTPGVVDAAGTKVAFRLVSHGGACANRVRVGVFDVERAAWDVPDMPAEQGHWNVLSVAWTGPGTLAAALVPGIECDDEEPEPQMRRDAGRIWRLQGDGWTPSDEAGLAFAVRGGTSAVIEGSTQIDAFGARAPNGTLTLSSVDGSTHTVARDVDGFALAAL